MIISPNAALWRMREAEKCTSSSISFRESRKGWEPFAKYASLTAGCENSPLLICVTTASTMMTAESTIIPKSMAPRLIRLPSMPNAFIIPKAKSMLSGMTLATTSPARQLPRKSTSTKMTISPPSTRFRAIVPSTRSTSRVLSMKGSMTTPSGSDFCICAIRAFTFLMTSWKFSPLSMMAMPATTSPSPLRVTTPKRVA